MTMIAVEESTEAGIIVVAPGKRLTSQNAGEFMQIIRAIPATFAPMVIVKMSDTTFVDSAGVGALVQAMKHLTKVSGRFALAELRPEIHRAFQLMNLQQVFDMYETEALARASLTARRT
jgi:anti-sigma B factor antagonist